MQQRARDLNTRKSTKREQQQKLTIESTEIVSIGCKQSTFDSHQLTVRNEHVWVQD